MLVLQKIIGGTMEQKYTLDPNLKRTILETDTGIAACICGTEELAKLIVYLLNQNEQTRMQLEK